MTLPKQEQDETLPFHFLPAITLGQGFDLLSGIRVIDLTTSVAGPFSTMLLADMGAEVIKIERPQTGDDSRSWGPPFLDGESLWFLAMNRNKKSIALDYAKPAGLAVVHDLIATADVVVVNLPPRAAAKLGVDDAALRRIKPDLIYVSITGFGMTGQRSDWTCYDLIAEGYSGIMDLTGEISGDAQKGGAPAADMLAGQDAAFATVSSLFARQKTGRGRTIDIALVDSMTRFLACRMVPFLGSGELPRRSGGKDSVIAIYQTFETADQPITLGLGNDAIWQRFWDALGEPAFGGRAEFKTNADRRARRGEIVSRIQEILKHKTRSEWLAILRAARIPAGPINRLDEVIQDETLLARGLFYRLQTPECDVPQVGTGIQIDGRANIPSAAPPQLGQHTDVILREILNYDLARINQLKADALI